MSVDSEKKSSLDAGADYGRAPSCSLFSALRRLPGRLWSFVFFTEVNALLNRGGANNLDEGSAAVIHPQDCDPAALFPRFKALYVSLTARSKEASESLAVGRALVQQHWKRMAVQGLSMGIETCVRLCTPFFLREFLIWLEDYKDDKSEYWRGWMWGLLLSLGPLLYAIIHHRVFLSGLLTGFRMRLTVMAAVHDKLLKLNTSSVSRVTTGHIVNLSSSDIERFELASGFWPYLIYGPLEGLFVLLAVSLVLGFVPAVAGMSCILLLIPAQSVLAKYIARCRMKTTRVTDKRINLISELISGSLAVKMLRWEDPSLNDVGGIRRKEHRLLAIKNTFKGVNMSLPFVTQGIIACITFVTYRFTNGSFNVPDVFFALSLMTLPRLSLANFFVLAVEFTSEMSVTFKRLDAFLRLPEPLSGDHTGDSMEQGNIEVLSGDFGWYKTRDEKRRRSKKSEKRNNGSSRKWNSKEDEGVQAPQLVQTLTGLNLTVQSGTLVAIVGMVGSGKSSLLTALLNDMDIISSDAVVRLHGSRSLCPQVPWIMQGSVRENITFGKPYDENFYQSVVSSCALNPDLDQFPDGDRTELGERGINISGGQKARVALARAAYSRADINLLDDPLSAVDPRVGRILFDKCVGPEGLMRNSTRLLVTHQLQFLPLCDRIIVMNEGRIEADGTWKDVEDLEILSAIQNEHHAAAVSLDSGVSTEDTNQTGRQIFPAESDLANEESSDAEKQSKNGGAQLVQAEAKEIGRISFGVYWEYLCHVRLIPVTAATVVLAGAQVVRFLSDLWIARWASSDDDEQDDSKWIWVLVSMTAVSSLMNLTSILALFALLLLGSTKLHSEMVHRVLHAPLKFFHVNPAGRILNRFARDMSMQDEELPFVSIDVLANAAIVVGTFVLVCIALPYMSIFFVGALWAFWRIRRTYVLTSREVKRFDGITRSPVYAMISSNIKGLATIRAFGSEGEFQERFLQALTLNGTWRTAFLLTSRWVAARMDGMGALIVSLSAILAVLLAEQISPEVLGLALTYAITLSGVLQWITRQTAELENTMTSVERNLEYTRLEQEPPRVVDGAASEPEGWPYTGTIEYEGVTARYREGLDPVLKNLSFVIPGGSSVGIVGRTGSGKSSLLLTLFRLIDLQEGVIKVDGVDTSSIGIDVLRKHLAVIPQDPVLFGGTLRSNLDPWNEQSDAKIWAVLREIKMDGVLDDAKGLDTPIAECGSNLSVGQRQLLCLARALLADAEILALDEATANVDRLTDSLIQESLRSLIAEKNKTFLVIAHRIDTVMDCDILLVLDEGVVAEFGNPGELLGRKDGHFAKMVSAAKQATELDCSS